MLTLVILEGIVILLLTVLVAGLLRSHAEILRTLDRLGAGDGTLASTGGSLGLGPTRRSTGQAPTDVISGVTLDGETRSFALTNSRGFILAAFLSSGCSTCKAFWTSFGRELNLPHPDIRPVIVTKDATEESTSDLHTLAPGDIPLVMSSDSWDSFRVPGTPYFQLIDTTNGAVLGEGSAANWSRLLEMIRRSLGDDDSSTDLRRSTRERLIDSDEELRRAGIAPGDETLFRKPEGDA